MLGTNEYNFFSELNVPEYWFHFTLLKRLELSVCKNVGLCDIYNLVTGDCHAGWKCNEKKWDVQNGKFQMMY